MRIPLSWLNDYVKIDDLQPEEITAKLGQIGFEVEEVIDSAKGLNHIVVGHIVDIKQHPNADRLWVCQVETGADKPLQILTSAKNIKVGDYVPVALDGAVVADGTKIETGTIRGEISQGMFCGGDEVGVTEEEYAGAGVYGILILHEPCNPGTPIADVLGKNDVVLEVSFTPNRADAMSMIGIARELAAIFKRKFKMPSLTYKVNKEYKNDISVNILNEQKCQRYMGAKVVNVKNGKSPLWMQKRLILAGHKPYSALVDITNYVLHEMGQPMHAFDVKEIVGKEINIRDAKVGEKIVLLDEKEYELNEDILTISNEVEPMVVAGVMGGKTSGTYENTKEVFFESAIFDYACIRKTAKALGLSSSSSARFSKGVYLQSAVDGLNRALSLVCELGLGDICDKIVDKHQKLPTQKVVYSSVERICTRLAVKVPTKEMVAILNRLEIKTTASGDKLKSIVPPFRTDITREEDICEEIGRSISYDLVDENNTTPTKTAFRGEASLKTQRTNLVRHTLCDNGLNEILTFQFISPKMCENFLIDPKSCIEIKNPLGKDYSLLRTSLMPNMLATIAYNERQKNENLALFEVAKVFHAKSLPLTELPDEPTHLCFALSDGDYDFYDAKNLLNLVMEKLGLEVDFRQSVDNRAYHPGVCADVYFHGKKIGALGQIHPKVAQNFDINSKVFACEVDLSQILEGREKVVKASPVDKLPYVVRDLAFVVDQSVPGGDVAKAVESSNKKLIKNACVFDVYTGAQVGEGKKSVAVKFSIKQGDETLKDEQISAIMNDIIAFCQKNLKATLRG